MNTEHTESSVVLNLKSGYARTRNESTAPYRVLTFAEVTSLRAGQTVEFIDRFGAVRNAKVNGAPKRWIRRPSDVQVPLKYGLYEYFRAVYVDGKPFASTRLVTPCAP